VKVPSLRRGLLIRLGFLMLGFSVMASVVIHQMSLRFGDEAYDEWLLDSARSLSLLVRVESGQVMVDLPGSTVDAFVFDAHDRVLFRIDDQKEGLIAGQSILPFQPMGAQEVNYVDLTVDGQAMRAVQLVRRDLRPGASVSILVAETLHKRHRLASRVLGTVMALGGVLCLLTIFLVRDAVTRGLRPVRSLADVVRSHPPGDLARLPDTDVPQELKTFTDAINDLLGKLDEAARLQRRFIADAAHQLRTPLAALSVELEYSIRESDPALHLQSLTQLQGGINRLSRLSNQLLTLARAEPGALASSTFSDIDLRTLVREAGMRLLPRCAQANIDLGFEGHGHPIVRGDALLLEEAVNNLLDNAMRYAGVDAQVTLSVAHQGAQACIVVEDNGRGVAPSEIDRLTERFHRPPGSAPGGSGLGLAIVHEITRLHGGTLVIGAVAPHGLRVQINLPSIGTQASHKEESS
jgi:two-component system sensor histidine kinase TctE